MSLKGVIAANWLYKNGAEIEAEVQHFLQRFSPQDALQLVDADGLLNIWLRLYAPSDFP